jgi:serine/threonine-protein phosphatase PP1 catalytic subunit
MGGAPSRVTKKAADTSTESPLNAVPNEHLNVSINQGNSATGPPNGESLPSNSTEGGADNVTTPTTQPRTILVGSPSTQSPVDPATSNLSPTNASTTLGSYFGSPKVDKYDLDEFITRLLNARNQKFTKSVCLKNAEIIYICHRVREVFMDQPILLELNPPVNIVGESHGSYVWFCCFCGFVG